MIHETERLWGLGWGGWWQVWSDDREEATEMLGWTMAYHGLSTKPPPAKAPPAPRKVTGKPAPSRVRRR